MAIGNMTASTLREDRDQLRASVLDHFGALLQLLRAFLLFRNERELLALHRERFGLPLELNALIVADLF